MHKSIHKRCFNSKRKILFISASNLYKYILIKFIERKYQEKIGIVFFIVEPGKIWVGALGDDVGVGGFPGCSGVIII